MNTTVSIIIPFYNPPKLRFRKCIESIIDQSFNDFEIILVNDGSEEEYIKIVNEYAQKDTRIRLINKANEGVSVARNVGIEVSIGKYISFIDADDYVEPIFLDVLLKGMIDAELSVCGISEQYYPIVDRWENINLFCSQPTLYNGIQYINFCANKMFNSSIIKDNSIYFDKDVKLGEDALFLNKYLEYCNGIRLNSNLLYHYIPSNTSALKKFQSSYWEWEKQIIEKQWNMFHLYNLMKNQELAMVHWLYIKFKGALNYYIWNLDDKKVSKCKVQEIISHPLFNEFYKYNWKKETPHFTKNDRIILYLWSKFRLKGVFIVKKLHEWRNIIRR